MEEPKMRGIIGLMALLTCLLSFGCKQGEGERCEIKDDCEDGLDCVGPAGAKTCETGNNVRADAAPDFDAPPTPDAGPTPDADSTPDAAVPDAALPDATPAPDAT